MRVTPSCPAKERTSADTIGIVFLRRCQDSCEIEALTPIFVLWRVGMFRSTPGNRVRNGSHDRDASPTALSIAAPHPTSDTTWQKS